MPHQQAKSKECGIKPTVLFLGWKLPVRMLYYVFNTHIESSMYIQQIGPRYYLINPAGLILKEFSTLEQAQQYLNLETA
jgi:hypothetical protein